MSWDPGFTPPHPNPSDDEDQDGSDVVQSVAGLSGAVTAADLAAELGPELLASPAITGTPTADTAAPGTNTEQLATTEFVQAEAADKTPTVGSALATTGTIDLDMAALNDTIQTISLTGNPTFTSSNRAAGRSVTVKLIAGGSSRTIAWPAWIPLGAALATSLASGKTAVFTVTFWDTTDAAATAAYSAQP